MCVFVCVRKSGNNIIKPGTLQNARGGEERRRRRKRSSRLIGVGNADRLDGAAAAAAAAERILYTFYIIIITIIAILYDISSLYPQPPRGPRVMVRVNLRDDGDTRAVYFLTTTTTATTT